MATPLPTEERFLCYGVAKELTQLNRRDIAFLYDLPPSFKEAPGLDIMEKLMELKVVSSSNLNGLVRLLREIGREDLASRVEEYMNKESRGDVKNSLIVQFESLSTDIFTVHKNLEDLKTKEVYLAKEEDDRRKEVDSLLVKCDKLVKELQRTIKEVECRAAAKVRSKERVDRGAQTSPTEVAQDRETEGQVQKATAAQHARSGKKPRSSRRSANVKDDPRPTAQWFIGMSVTDDGEFEPTDSLLDVQEAAKTIPKSANQSTDPSKSRQRHHLPKGERQSRLTRRNVPIQESSSSQAEMDNNFEYEDSCDTTRDRSRTDSGFEEDKTPIRVPVPALHEVKEHHQYTNIHEETLDNLDENTTAETEATLL